MNKEVNKTNRIRLWGIRKELFDMANSYAGDEHGHIAGRLHGISNSVYNIRDIMEVLYPLDNTPAEDQHSKEKFEPGVMQVCNSCVYQNKAVTADCVSPIDCQHLHQSQPPKPLAQYLDEYIRHEEELGNISPEVGELYAYGSWQDLLQQALDAYESTENVRINFIKMKEKA